MRHGALCIEVAIGSLKSRVCVRCAVRIMHCVCVRLNAWFKHMPCLAIFREDVCTQCGVATVEGLSHIIGMVNDVPITCSANIPIRTSNNRIGQSYDKCQSFQNIAESRWRKILGGDGTSPVYPHEGVLLLACAQVWQYISKLSPWPTWRLRSQHFPCCLIGHVE